MMSNIIKKDKWGRPLNEKGQIIDKFGRPIFDENGKMIPYPEARFYMDTGTKVIGFHRITEEVIKNNIEHLKKYIKDEEELKAQIKLMIEESERANRRFDYYQEKLNELNAKDLDEETKKEEKSKLIEAVNKMEFWKVFY